jgi:hypothetical protein
MNTKTSKPAFVLAGAVGFLAAFVGYSGLHSHTGRGGHDSAWFLNQVCPHTTNTLQASKTFFDNCAAEAKTHK